MDLIDSTEIDGGKRYSRTVGEHNAVGRLGSYADAVEKPPKRAPITNAMCWIVGVILFVYFAWCCLHGLEPRLP